jgi:hypothetical protein
VLDGTGVLRIAASLCTLNALKNIDGAIGTIGQAAGLPPMQAVSAARGAGSALLPSTSVDLARARSLLVR